MENELDFKVEAEALRRSSGDMAAWGLADVRVPTPLDDMVARRVLCMSFEEGVKITDGAAIDAMGVDRQEIMRRVIQVVRGPESLKSLREFCRN